MTYLLGSEFRAIDSNAAADDEPMSAALEAHLANNHERLHRIGGGSAMRLGTPTAATLTGDNVFQQASAGLSVMHMQPFLVTRGLSEVRIDWHGRITGYDLDVRLVLQGFGVVEATWAQGGTNNVHRSITLTLPAPAEYEYETDLILYQFGKPGALDGSLTAARLNQGLVEFYPSGPLSSNPAACVVSAQPDTEGSSEQVQPFETISRLINTNLSDNSSGDLAITTSAASGSGLRFCEAELARVAPRSIQVTMRHA